LDLCEHHGIWFDNAELQKTLAGAAGLEVDPQTPLEQRQPAAAGAQGRVELTRSGRNGTSRSIVGSSRSAARISFADP
jgi:hypothetical protein